MTSPSTHPPAKPHAALRTYLQQLSPHTHPPNDDEDLFELGYLNSLHAFALVEFVEHNYALTLRDEDLSLANFRTINTIANLIQTYTQPA